MRYVLLAGIALSMGMLRAEDDVEAMLKQLEVYAEYSAEQMREHTDEIYDLIGHLQDINAGDVGGEEGGMEAGMQQDIANTIASYQMLELAKQSQSN